MLVVELYDYSYTNFHKFKTLITEQYDYLSLAASSFCSMNFGYIYILKTGKKIKGIT